MFEATIILSKNPKGNNTQARNPKMQNTVLVRDPYVQKNAAVKLQGVLECLHQLEIGKNYRCGIFKIDTDKLVQQSDMFCIPAILLDALWRFGIIHKDEDEIPIYVPEMGGEMTVVSTNDRELPTLQLFGSNPRIEGEMIFNDWVQAITPQGKVIAMAENLVARRMGSVVKLT